MASRNRNMEQYATQLWFTSKKQHLDMFSFLETTLGNVVLRMWQSKKKAHAEQISAIKALGKNPYNFTSLIRTMILGLDPTRENTLLQDTPIRNLEQLSIKTFDYIVPCTNDFVALISKSGKAFDDELCNKYFVKLPGDLGKQIHEKCKEDYALQQGL